MLADLRTTRSPAGARLVAALSADELLLRRLRKGASFTGLVHSVFDRVVNIDVGGGALVSLSTRQLDNAPDTAVLDIALFRERGIACGDPVGGEHGTLSLGASLVVNFNATRAWRAGLPSYPASELALRTNLDLVGIQLDRFGIAASTARRRVARAFDTQVAMLLDEHASQLVDALSRRDEERGCEHARAMLGLGPGLTPSGDDFLVGLFAVLNIEGSPGHGLLGGGKAVLAGAEQATHEISLAALRAAANGRVRESIAAFIGQMTVGGSRERVLESLQRVLAIGSTSGADIAAGVAAGFEIHLNLSDGDQGP